MKYTNVLSVSVFIIFGFVSRPPVLTADCDNQLTVHYNERPPYLETLPQGVKGLTADPATLVFKNAGLSFTWEKTPSKRQMAILKRNIGCDCLVGWFKNPEREIFAKYTHSIYQDKAQIALTRADNQQIKSGGSVEEILANRNLSLLVKDGYSYGSFIDKKIAENNPKLTKKVYENIKMLELIYRNRYDYFFIAQEEANGLIKASGFPRKDFKYIQFSNMPEGEKRYILCSQKVGDDIIEKLNTVITEPVLNNK